MARKRKAAGKTGAPTAAGLPSALVDTRVIYCGDNLEQVHAGVGQLLQLIYIDPPFNPNRNYEVFGGETKEKRAFTDRHASTQSYINYMRPRCYELRRILKDTGSRYYHCVAASSNPNDSHRLPRHRPRRHPQQGAGRRHGRGRAHLPRRHQARRPGQHVRRRLVPRAG